MAKAKKDQSSEVAGSGTSLKTKLRPVKVGTVSVRVVGISPIVTHRWSEKAKGMMRDKHAGKKTRERDVRDPEKEGMEAAYLTDDGKYGVPAMAIKAAMINAAHKDIGIEKTLVRKAIFLICHDSQMVLPFDEHSDPVIQEDVVRVGQGSTDLRYRPYFYTWSLRVMFQVDMELLTVDDVVTLLQRAGFGVGIMEMRPEKGGEFGRFAVDTTYGVKVSS